MIELTKRFGNKSIIVKDFVKSEKHHWNDACFIPRASDETKVLEVVNRFLELRGNALNEGVVFRAFEELEFLTNHSKGGMSLTKEFRMVVQDLLRTSSRPSQHVVCFESVFFLIGA